MVVTINIFCHSLLRNIGRLTLNMPFLYFTIKYHHLSGYFSLSYWGKETNLYSSIFIFCLYVQYYSFEKLTTFAFQWPSKINHSSVKLPSLQILPPPLPKIFSKHIRVFFKKNIVLGFFGFLKIILFIYLFLAVLGLHC